MIHINGSYLEGGGQIVRQAIGLSILKGEAVEIKDIRKGRKNPGLKHQHFHSNAFLVDQCSAIMRGNEIGSRELLFNPGTFHPQHTEIDLETAASIPLFLQSVLFPLCFSHKKIKIVIKGGTDVKWSMSLDYINQVFIPHITQFVNDISLRLIKRGYYPKGGGTVELKISPKFKRTSYDSFEEFKSDVHKQTFIQKIERGTLKQIHGISHAAASLMNREVAERQARNAKFLLKHLNVPISIKTMYQNTLSPGSGITLWGYYAKKGKELFEDRDIIGSDALGEKNISAETVGKNAAEEFIHYQQSNAPIDDHIADNLVPWLIFGGSYQCTSITNHTKTSIYTVNKFLSEAYIESKENNISYVKKK